MYSERPSRIAGSVVWTSSSTSAQRILPDGCMDLLWLGERLLIAGPDTHAFFADHRPGTLAVGLRLAPGVGPQVFGLPAHEVRDQRVPLDALWSDRVVRRIEAQLDDPASIGHQLERVAHERLGGEAVALTTTAIADELGRGATVDDVAQTFGLSSRQLHRRSLVAYGYGPKLLSRILRLQRTLRLARTGLTFAETAAIAGYADQAHQARDVRELAGVPLGQLV